MDNPCGWTTHAKALGWVQWYTCETALVLKNPLVLTSDYEAHRIL